MQVTKEYVFTDENNNVFRFSHDDDGLWLKQGDDDLVLVRVENVRAFVKTLREFIRNEMNINV